jgi:predicted PurR-regulated permease PerM
MERPPVAADLSPEGSADGPAPAPAPLRGSGPVTFRITPWSLVRAVLILAAGLVALRVSAAASTVLWWLAIATVVAGAFQPAVVWLRRWLPSWVAIIAVILGVMALVGLVGYRGVAELTAQFEVLRANALDAARSIQSSGRFGDISTEFGLVEKTTRFFDSLPVVLGGSAGSADPAATVQSAASSGSALFAIATFAVLMLIFGSTFVQAALDQIDDVAVRDRVSVLVTRSYHAAYRYVWLMAARAVVVGVVGGLGCAALGLETPTALGVAFAALSVIPGLGIMLAAIPVAIYTAVSSPATGVLVFVLAVVVQAAETTIVQRRIDAASVHVGPMPTIVAALIGLQLYGPGGLLVGLAVAVYGLAVLIQLTEAHDEVFTAMRQLVGEDLTAHPGTVIVAEKGSRVVVESGADVEVEPGADAGDP